jgi:hypothetical protein
VFDLPAGFTVNGPCVVDNRFVCGAAAPVPEPSTLALLAAGRACSPGAPVVVGG